MTHITTFSDDLLFEMDQTNVERKLKLKMLTEKTPGAWFTSDVSFIPHWIKMSNG